MSREQIDLLIKDRRLEATNFDDNEIAGLWSKALTSDSDARLSGLSVDGAFSRAYQASLLVTTAILAAAGYRIRGTTHHYIAFYTLEKLEEPAISPFSRTLDRMRQTRHSAVYDATDDGEIHDDLSELLELNAKLITAARAWITTKRPALIGQLR